MPKVNQPTQTEQNELEFHKTCRIAQLYKNQIQFFKKLKDTAMTENIQLAAATQYLQNTINEITDTNTQLNLKIIDLQTQNQHLLNTNKKLLENIQQLENIILKQEETLHNTISNQYPHKHTKCT